MGYSLPEVESAPAFFLRSYPQAYPQGKTEPRETSNPGKQAPPLAKIVRGGIYTPQQKIFAKVKAVIWL
jgi:hypothetical protein